MSISIQQNIALHKNEVLIHAATHIHLENIIQSKKDRYKLCDLIYMKFPEYSNVQTQKIMSYYHRVEVQRTKKDS